jgi:peptidoglycan/LPS O-acetylase OafA/YrhL
MSEAEMRDRRLGPERSRRTADRNEPSSASVAERSRNDSAGVEDGRNSLEALTGVRFLAALAVVLYHAVPAQFPLATGPLMRLVDSGFAGVSFFFVLSGFILSYKYLRPAQRGMRCARREFWWARIARIYPVYLLALAISFPTIVRGLREPFPLQEYHRMLGAAILSPFLLQGWWPASACRWNCPGWSLSVEAFFYVLFPFVGVALSGLGNRAIVRTAWGTWALGMVLPALYLAVAPDGISSPTHLDTGAWLVALKFNPLPHLHEFLFGMCAGVIFIRRQASDTGDQRFVEGSIARVIAVVAVVVTAAVIAFAPDVPFVLLHTGVLAPVWALVIYVLAAGDGAIARWLGSRALLRLGEASYALYLIHAPLSVYFQKALEGRGVPIGPGWSVALYVAVTVSMSLAVFHWIEDPARRYLRLKGPQTGARAVVSIAQSPSDVPQ